MRFVAFVGVVAVAGMHACAWTLSRDVIGAPGFRGQLPSMSYTPFNGCASAEEEDGQKAKKAAAAGKPSFVQDLFPKPEETPKPDPKACQPEQIRADLQAIAPYARVVRTYSATRGMEL